MKNKIVLILGVALMLSITGCSSSDKETDSRIEQQKEDIEGNIKESMEVNAFDGLQVFFEGFNGNGRIKIDTSNCSKEVQEYVQFEYDTAFDGKLRNEHNIVISAVSKHEKLTITESERTYTVSGLYMFDEDGDNYIGEFSDGMAWFRYINPNDNKTYIAYMDNTGLVKFQFDASEINYGNIFKNGNVMIKFNNENAVAIVDKSGEVVKTIDITKNTIAEANGIENADSDILFCRKGYFVVKTKVENFSNNYYLYTFYDSNGECIFIDKSDRDYSSTTYEGEDVISLEGEYPQYRSYYFLNANKEIEDLKWPFFNGSYSVYDIDDKNNTITILDNRGNMISEKVEGIDLYVYSIAANYYNGNVMLRSVDKKECGYYNFENDTFISMTEYATQLSDIPTFYNNVIIAELQGADGKNYMGIFDMNWNLVKEPIKGGVSALFSNCIRVSDRISDSISAADIDNYNYYYYDYLGNLLFETGNKKLEFSEGLAYSGDFQWVNENNEVVIDGLDFSNVKTVQLSVVESVETSYPIEGTYIGSQQSIIEIQNEGTIIYTESEEVFNLSATKISDNMWKTSELVYSDGYRCEMILYMDESGNLLADATSDNWIDEYFRRQ